ncbi:MAG: S9 family peptidase [Alphaproteobacteria bacterium]|nr:MAG: S9 family peptidase [Alphaproteobacteria bacterium]
MRSQSIRSGLALLLCTALLVSCGPDNDDQAPPAEESVTDAIGEGLIPRQAFFGNPTRHGPKISPDGTQIAYLAPLDGVMNIWVGPAEQISMAVPITGETRSEIGKVNWSADGAYLIYNKLAGANKGWHVFATQVANGQTRDLTPIDEPNIKAHVAYINPAFPDEAIIAINDRDGRYPDFYRVFLSTGERELLMENSWGDDSGFIEVHFDGNSVPRLAIETTSDGGGNLLVSSDGKDWQIIRHINAIDIFPFEIRGFNADNTTAYIYSSRDRNTSGVYALNLQDGTQRLIGANDRADIEDVIVHPETRELEAFAIEYDREEWVTASADVAKTLAFLARAASGDFHIVSRSADGNRWIVFYDQVTEPGDYYLVDAVAHTARKLFTSRQDLIGAPLARMYPRIIKSRDGLDLVSYLTLPEGTDPDGDGRPEMALPMVVLVHGGPWGPRDHFGYNADHQWLANRGYAVLSVNYRGTLGFGKNFVEAGTHEMGGKMQDDLMDAVEWANVTRISDPERVAIMGEGFGGYAVMVGLSRDPEAFACGVNLMGMANLISLIENLPERYEPVMDATWYRRAGDPRTEEGRALLKERSPFFYLDRISKPLLMVQSDRFGDIAVQESETISQTLRNNGVPVTYLQLTDEGYGFYSEQNVTAYGAVTEAFLAGCLGGMHEPIGDALMDASLTVREGADNVPGLQQAVEEKSALQSAPELTE